MCSETVVVWWVIGLLFGPPMAYWPYELARLKEIPDAIGRKPSGRVEPADWPVGLARIVGVGSTLFGLFFLVSCVLT